MSKHKIVDQNDQIIDDLTGLSMFEAEVALCKMINFGHDAYIADVETKSTTQLNTAHVN